MAAIQEIKAQNPLEQVVLLCGVKLTGNGKYLRACCPFHNDRTPSFVVDIETGRWRCFGRCDAANGRWLDVIDFVGWRLYGARWNARDKAMFKAALAVLQENAVLPDARLPTESPQRRRVYKPGYACHFDEPCGEPCPEPAEGGSRTISASSEHSRRDAGMLLERVASLYQAQLWADASAAPLGYLRGRGFTDAALKAARIGYATGEQVRQYLRATNAPVELAHELNLLDPERNREFMRGRIIFPDVDSSGHVTHMVGRKWAKYLGKRSSKYLSMKGRGKPLFGWARLDKGGNDRPVFVTESLTDWLTLFQWGFEAVATLGIALHTAYAQRLSALPRPLIYLPHNDESGTGLEAVRAWREMVGRGEVLELPSPIGGKAIKDVNDLATAPGGREAFFRPAIGKANAPDEDQARIWAT